MALIFPITLNVDSLLAKIVQGFLLLNDWVPVFRVGLPLSLLPCLPTCLLTCLPSWLPAQSPCFLPLLPCLLTCLPACLPVSLLVSALVCLHDRRLVCRSLNGLLSPGALVFRIIVAIWGLCWCNFLCASSRVYIHHLATKRNSKGSSGTPSEDSPPRTDRPTSQHLCPLVSRRPQRERWTVRARSWTPRSTTPPSPPCSPWATATPARCGRRTARPSAGAKRCLGGVRPRRPIWGIAAGRFCPGWVKLVVVKTGHYCSKHAIFKV